MSGSPSHVNGAAAEYLAKGWSPIPIPSRQKNPGFRGWQSFRADANTTFPGNIGLLLGGMSNGLVDIDLDCREAMVLADEILPPTDAVFGRKSKPRSHFLYLCNPPPDTRQHVDTKQPEADQESMLVELRSTGAQTVAPPSVHICGEAIEWVSAGEPAKIDGVKLKRCVAELAGLSILARHWPDLTNRYNAEGALIGALLRSGRSEPETIRLLNVLRKATGPSRDHKPEKSVPRLAEMLAARKPVPGLKKLREYVGADVVQKAADWLELSTARSKRYDNTGGCLWLMTTKDGEEKRTPLSNFVAEIEEVINRDDGSGDMARSFIVKSEHHGNLEVPSDEFDSMAWVTTHWGPHARVYVGRDTKAHFAAAIKEHSCEADERVIYCHLGWRKIEDRWIYLHAGGAIGAEGPVQGFEVEPGGKLVHYQLPAVRDLRESVRASISMKALGASGYLSLAAIYRAPLVEFLEMTTSVFFEGATGSFKSAVQGVALSHWGSSWDGAQFPANWTGTSNALEKIAFIAKDALFVVDDFKPSGTSQDVARLNQTAERLLRSAANLGGRDRMRADSTLRASYWPRGVVMSSGEDVPQGHSLRARMVIHHIERNDVDVVELTRLQNLAIGGVLAEAMAGYIQWLASLNLDSMHEKLHEQFSDLRNQLSGNHARTPTNLANLMLGAGMLAAFAQDCGALTANEAEEFLKESRAAITDQGTLQDAEQASEDPARRFIALIREALGAGRVHLAGRNGKVPFGRERECGWAERVFYVSGERSTEWTHSGDKIGWIEDDNVWLKSDVAYSAAERLSREQNRSLGLTPRSLGKRLAEAGLLKSSGSDRTERNVRAEGDVTRGLHINAARLLEEAPLCSSRFDTFATLRRAIEAARSSGDEKVVKAVNALLTTLEEHEPDQDEGDGDLPF